MWAGGLVSSVLNLQVCGALHSALCAGRVLRAAFQICLKTLSTAPKSEAFLEFGPKDSVVPVSGVRLALNRLHAA